jgi:hypothetical protein
MKPIISTARFFHQGDLIVEFLLQQPYQQYGNHGMYRIVIGKDKINFIFIAFNHIITILPLDYFLFYEVFNHPFLSSYSHILKTQTLHIQQLEKQDPFKLLTLVEQDGRDTVFFWLHRDKQFVGYGFYVENDALIYFTEGVLTDRKRLSPDYPLIEKALNHPFLRDVSSSMKQQIEIIKNRSN